MYVADSMWWTLNSGGFVLHIIWYVVTKASGLCKPPLRVKVWVGVREPHQTGPPCLMGKHFAITLIQSVDLVPLRLELTSVHLTTVMACVMTPDGPYRYSVIPELFWYRYINSGLYNRDGKNVSSISVLPVFSWSLCPPRNPELSCDVLKSISWMWLGRDFGQTRGEGWDRCSHNVFCCDCIPLVLREWRLQCYYADCILVHSCRITFPSALLLK